MTKEEAVKLEPGNLVYIAAYIAAEPIIGKFRMIVDLNYIQYELKDGKVCTANFLWVYPTLRSCLEELRKYHQEKIKQSRVAFQITAEQHEPIVNRLTDEIGKLPNGMG